MCFDTLFGGSTPKTEDKPVAPADNSAEIGAAELKRKRAAASSFGRKSTIATSGMGDTTKGVKLGANGSYT